MGFFDDAADSAKGAAPAAAGGAGTIFGGGPAAGAFYNQMAGAGIGGGLPGMSDQFSKFDPTHAATSGYSAIPVDSQFKAQGPEGFAQQLAWSQGNLNNANFAAFNPGANGQSFAQGLAGNYQNAQNMQQNLMGNLQQQSMGQGAGAQLSQNYLNNAMNQNAANAMGQAASSKGINPAMAARMAGQNTAAMNAQAAGQGANMNLQSQLAAQQQLGALSGQNMAQNGGMFNNMMGQANQQYGTMLNANQGINSLNQQTAAQNASNAMQAQGINAGTEQANAQQKGKMFGGAMSGLGSMIGMAAAHGGQIPYVTGGDVPVVLSPGERVIPKEIASDEGAASSYIESDKGRVPGKAKYEGDDIKNDTFKTKLASGDVVIPREAAKDDEKAKRFLQALGKWRKK